MSQRPARRRLIAVAGWVCGLAAALGPKDASAGVIEARDDRSLEACNSKLKPGDTCSVAPGTYRTAIRPSRSGREDARIVYACAGEGEGACVIDTDGPETLALAGPPGGQGPGSGGASFVTVEGFTFEDGPVRVAGRGSRGILLDRVATRDADNKRPCASVTTEGGEGTVISRFDFFQPARSSNAPGERAGCDVLSLATNAGPAGEKSTTLRDGRIRGGWNALQIGRCIDCVLDGVTITGAKNHTLSVGASGNKTENLEIRNSIVMASTGFREPMPFVAWQVSGLTLLNNAFITGWAIPAFGDASIRHELTVRGPVTIRNNIFYSDRASVMGLANNGAFSGPNPIAWSVDHNAYAGAGSLGGSLWTDSRDCSLGPQGKLAGSGCPEKSYPPGAKGAVAPGWAAAGFDAHSIVFENTDMVAKSRDSGFPVRGPLWGVTAPFTGAMVECLMPGGNGFATDPRWGGGLRPGDRVEYDFDGTVRTVASVKPDVSCGGADKRVAITLDPPPRPRPNSWILSFGQQKIEKPAYAFVPQPGSPVIDAGDDAHCGHPVKGAHCDIGPVENDGRPEGVSPAGASPVAATPPAASAPETAAAAGAGTPPPGAAPSSSAAQPPAAPPASNAAPVSNVAPAPTAGPPENAAPAPSGAAAPQAASAGSCASAPLAAAGESSPGPEAGAPGDAPVLENAKPERPAAGGWDPRVSGVGLGSTGIQVREALGKPVSFQNQTESRPGAKGTPASGGRPRAGGQGAPDRNGPEGEAPKPRGSEEHAENRPDTADAREPEKRPEGGGRPAPARRTAVYDGLTLTLEGDPGKADFQVVQFQLTGGTFEVAPGIRIGTPRETLIALLGEPASSREAEGEPETLVYLLAGGEAQARVSIRDGKVSEVRVARRRTPGGA